MAARERARAKLGIVAVTTALIGLLLPFVPVLAAPLDVRVNFQSETATVPAGYLRDFGEAYGSRTGTNQGSGLSYGWVTPGTTTPLNLVGNGRDRNVGIDQRLETLMHMQADDLTTFTGVKAEGAWEMGVANGTYKVTVSVGDQPGSGGVYDSQHTIKVESTVAIDRFQGSDAEKYRQATVTVTVTDGRLTLDPRGGTNTKINYVDILEQTTSSPSASASTSPTPSPTPAPSGGTAVNLKVNFQDEATTPPSGYLKDFGEAYGTRSNGQTYGWVRQDSFGTSLSLVGNGRNRTTSSEPDLRLATLMHMQLPAGSLGGVTTPGAWQIAVPNASYEVTVSVGDASGATDSRHEINVEGQVAIAGFVPTSTTKHHQATRVVTVKDGKLTIDAIGGSNTKINYATIKTTQTSTTQPYVTGVNPANGATYVSRDVFVAATVTLPNAGYGIDPNTLTSSTVYLTSPSGSKVPANLNTSGGGDIIVLQPTVLLDATTTYSFHVTTGLKDLKGAAFLAYQSSFTTGTSGGSSGGSVAFQKVSLSTATGKSFTTLVFGPDGKLYAGTIEGEILRFSVNADGSLGTPQTITSLQTANGGSSRMLIGMAFDPGATSSNLVMWVSHTYFAFNSAPDWTGKISRMSGANLETVNDYIVGLPRSIRDHITNSIAFGSDGYLYFNQGSNTAMGAPDSAWGLRPERALNAAVLRFKPSSITTPPLNVKTEDGGTYNPFATGAALTVYASGVRNAYDLLWHSNGRLYVPTNGSAAGGNTPGTSSPLPSVCTTRIDDGTKGDYTGPSVPGLSNVGTTQPDYLFRVVQGGYYGHPNPKRCEWVMNGGNPTSGADVAEVSEYPLGTAADRNYRGFAHRFGNNYSPNGVIEYKNSTAFGGSLKGKLLVVRYSGGDDVVILTPSSTTGDIAAAETGASGLIGFVDPLDIVEHVSSGNVYVSEFGGQKITLLRPTEGSAPPPPPPASGADISLQNLDGEPYPDRLSFNRIGSVSAPPSNGVHNVAKLLVRNVGTQSLTIDSFSFTGPFQLHNAIATPATIAAGGQLEISVRFVAETNGSGNGTHNGTLTIGSNDPDEPRTLVELSGFWQSVSEQGQEPNLIETKNLFGYETTITYPGEALNQNGLVSDVGDEVLSPYWQRANPNKPVTARQLAAFHTQGATATLRWHAKGSTTVNTVFTHAGIDGQSLLPHLNGSTTQYAAGSFAPTGVFGFKIDTEWSDPTKNDQTADMSNGCPGPCGHHVRFWPVRDRDGRLRPNTYLMVMDYAGINYDYNDNQYLVSNIKPEIASVDPNINGTIPGAPKVALDFNAGYAGTLADKDGQPTGFTSTQRNKLDPASTFSNSYQPAKLDINTSGAGTLTVTTSGTSTSGTNSGTDNTLVNGLRLDFDATADRFDVSGRLVGPLDQLTQGLQQGGVMFGPDQDNWVKLAAVARSTGPVIEFHAEQNGSGVTVGSTVPVPNPSTIQSLELHIIGNPDTGVVRAAYRALHSGSDTGLVFLPTTLRLTGSQKDRFFAVQAKGGIITSNKGTTTAVAIVYDRFAITGDPTAPAPSATALYRLDIGANANYTDKRGLVWRPDDGYFSPSTAIDEGDPTSAIANTDDDAIYATYRGNVGSVAVDQRVLSYALPISSARRVDLRLHFAERCSCNNAAGKRLFDIEAEGRLLREKLDIFSAAGGINTATVLSLRNVAVTDGTLNLVFRTLVDYAAINGIEVLPADATPPGTPTSLTATANLSGVKLDWADSSDGDIAAYNVYRALSATGTYTRLTSAGLLASEFQDSQAPAATTMYYRVSAVDSSGNESSFATASAQTSSSSFTSVSWSTAASSPITRHEALGGVVNGRLYVFGGYTGGQGGQFAPTPRADYYNPATNSWTRIRDLPTGLSHAGVAVEGTDIYFAGGYPLDLSTKFQTFSTRSVWKYNTVTDTYTPMPLLPAARGGGALVLNGRMLHFFGGSDSNRADSSSHWKLDLNTAGGWVAAASLPSPRNHLGGAAIGGKLYAVGGQSHQDQAATYLSAVHAYDPATNTWTAVASLPSARSHTGAATFVMGGRIIVVGGEPSYGSSINQVVAYSPSTNSWAQLSGLPAAKNSGVGGHANGQIFYTTGSSGSTTYKGVPQP